MPREASPSPSIWRPRGTRSWLLSLIAAMLVIALAALAAAMAEPLPFDSMLGLAGLVALTFPLHLLTIALGALVLAAVARRCGARLAAALFATVVLLATANALWPAMTLWRYAHADDVALSLGDYLANAEHVNYTTARPNRGVAYGTAGDGTKLLLDVWPAADSGGNQKRPAIVRIHGGGFVHGARDDMPDWDRWFNQRGYLVFDVGYRLPPPVRWLDEIGDVKCALGWVAAHAAEYGGDPAKISTVGMSAGATLAMLAAYSAGDPRLPPSCDVPPVRVSSVVNLYGVADMPALYDDSPSLATVHVDALQYIGGSPSEYPERHAAVSPLTYVTSAAPPTISFLGTTDSFIPRRQLDALDAALKRVGAVSEAYALPATNHGFDINWGGFATQFARAKIAVFLDRYR